MKLVMQLVCYMSKLEQIEINFIRVLNNNIQPDRLSQFNRYDQEGISGFQINTIDYNSIVMYPSFNSFAINSNLPTMERLDGSTWLANRTNLSVGDIEITDLLYGGLYAKLYFVTTEYESSPEDNFHAQDVYVKFYSDVNYSNRVSLNQNVDFKFKIVNTNEYSGTSSTNFYSKSLISGNQSYFIQNYTRTNMQYDYGDIEPVSYSQALIITQGFSYID
ncbi:hypothetical protein MNBD_BACTEROID03-1697 [hydrothermal vent metagenome]|uniref:Peptidase M12A domain-containing protein n=1 Tax=hydrothermal vent metagenome TaxID=652676 RepID=A0A3B0TX60_9ZZZZ